MQFRTGSLIETACGLTFRRIRETSGAVVRMRGYDDSA